MERNEILSKVDHTLLRTTATWSEIKALCDEAIAEKTASVCIAPCFVKRAVEYVNGKIPICTVVGFPNGNCTMETKIFETENAIANGASEIDMVINLGALKENDYDYVEREIAALAVTCHNNNVILKVIIETCLLDSNEIKKMCFVCASAEADYIKTSTGFSTEGANARVLKIMKETIDKNNLDLKIKAAGGIKDKLTAEVFIEIGADRLGTSKLIDILNKEEW